MIRKVLYLKNWSGNIFKYLKNSGSPEPLSLTEPLSPAETEPVPMSHEAIIAELEDVALQEEANYLYALLLHSSLSPNMYLELGTSMPRGTNYKV